MTETERQKNAAKTGLLVFAIAMFLTIMGGCCCTQQVKGDMTPQNDCPLIQAGWAAVDQLPKILR